MAELPAGLTAETRPDGKLNIVGTDDAGERYVARVADGASVSDSDVAALMAGDRERTTPQEYTGRLMAETERNRAAWEAGMQDDFMDAAERVAHAGVHKGQRTLGWSRKYEESYSKAFGHN